MRFRSCNSITGDLFLSLTLESGNRERRDESRFEPRSEGRGPDGRSTRRRPARAPCSDRPCLPYPENRGGFVGRRAACSGSGRRRLRSDHAHDDKRSCEPCGGQSAKRYTILPLSRLRRMAAPARRVRLRILAGGIRRFLYRMSLSMRMCCQTAGCSSGGAATTLPILLMCTKLRHTCGIRLQKQRSPPLSRPLRMGRRSTCFVQATRFCRTASYS